MNKHSNLDELLAYADGEIDARQAREVEEQLAQDPDARALVKELQAGSALLRAAFNEPLHEPLPPHIHETVDRELAAQRRPAERRAGQVGWLPMALAASLAALVVGLSGAYLLADRQAEVALARLQSMQRQDRVAMAAAVDRSLEKNVSGVAMDWENPDTGSRGVVTPIRTFKSTAGQWCREYQATLIAGRDETVTRAIACRQPEGKWDTKVELASDS